MSSRSIARYFIRVQVLNNGERLGEPMKIVGREAEALKRLVDAGNAGITSLDHPGVRLSGYIHDLRRDFGLAIETLDEKHGGVFSGSHARYVLRSEVSILELFEGRAAA